MNVGRTSNTHISISQTFLYNRHQVVTEVFTVLQHQARIVSMTFQSYFCYQKTKQSFNLTVLTNNSKTNLKVQKQRLCNPKNIGHTSNTRILETYINFINFLYNSTQGIYSTPTPKRIVSMAFQI